MVADHGGPRCLRLANGPVSAAKSAGYRSNVSTGLTPAQTRAFLNLSRFYRSGKRAAQLFGRLQRELDCDPRARPERGVHEIDGDGLFQQSVVRVVVGHHRMGQSEPPVTALAGAGRADDLDDRGAHAVAYAARCF